MGKRRKNYTLVLKLSGNKIPIEKYTLEDADFKTMKYENKEELLLSIIEEDRLVNLIELSEIKKNLKKHGDFIFELNYKNKGKIKRRNVLYKNDKNFIEDVKNFHDNLKSDVNYEKNVITSSYNRKFINGKFHKFDNNCNYQNKTYEANKYWNKIDNWMNNICQSVNEDSVLKSQLKKITHFMYNDQSLSEHTKYLNRRIKYLDTLSYANRVGIDLEQYRVSTKEEYSNKYLKKLDEEKPVQLIFKI